MKYLFSIILLVLVCGSGLSQEQELSYLVFRDDGLIHVDGDTEHNLLISEFAYPFRVKGWDPTGRYVVVVVPSPNENDKEALVVLDTIGLEGWPLLAEVEINSTDLYYVDAASVVFTVPTGELLISEDEQGLGVSRRAVYRWDFEQTSTEVTNIGNIPYAVGCGGGGPRRAIDLVYGAEVQGDASYEYNRRVFVPTPYGIVHSNACTSIRTLLTDPDTLQSVELASDLRWVTVSPDGGRVIGSSGNQLVAVDLATLDVMYIDSADAPIISMTWDADSAGFFYVQRTQNGETLDIFDRLSDRLDALQPHEVDTSPRLDDALRWRSTIRHYDFKSGTSTLSYEADAYAIGTMFRWSNSLVFSQIEWPEAWLAAFVDDWQVTLLADDLRGILVQPE